jgi:hypothetical protein
MLGGLAGLSLPCEEDGLVPIVRAQKQIVAAAVVAIEIRARPVHGGREGVRKKDGVPSGDDPPRPGEVGCVPASAH